MKVFLLFVTFYSIVIVDPQTNVSGNVPQKEELKSNDESLPDLSCILFGNVGCQSTCTLLGKLYAETKNNICNESFECICNFGRSNNLFALWNAKFEKSAVSTKLWTKTRRSSTKLKKDLMSILNQELLSGKEMKKQLESVLGEEVKNLKPNEKELINNYVDEEGNIDDENYDKLVEFINEQFNDDKFKNTIKELSPEYEQNFIKFMEKVNDETVIKHISHQVGKMLTPNFVNFVNEYLEENKKIPSESNETDKDDEEYYEVKNEISNIIVEALVNYIETDSKNSSISDDSESEKSTLQLFPEHDYPLPEDSVLLQFKNSGITINPEDMKGVGKRTWKSGENYIMFFRDKGSTHLVWDVNGYYFRMTEYYWDELTQVWIFGNVRIQFHIRESNSEHQWEFSPELTLLCVRKKNYRQSKCKWGKSENKEALEKYNGYIYAWCTLYKELVPKNCILFDY